MYKERISTLAERLSYALKSKKIKQVDLCNQLNITKGAMCHYIKGDYEPRQDRIDSIAKALNVNEAWLMGYDVPMDRQTYYSASSSFDGKLNLQLFSEGNSPSAEPELTEGEKLLLELFRKLPEGEQQMYLEVLRARLNAR